jgi:FO synthase subunit 1
MRNKKKNIKYFKDLSLKHLREKIREIKKALPHEKRKIITYSRNFTISLSNYCRNNCGYCFYNHRIPKHGKNKNIALLSFEDIEKEIKKAIGYDCKEALIMSGEQPETFQLVINKLKKEGYKNYVAYVKEICRSLLKSHLLPHLNIGLLNYEELKYLKPYNASMGLMLESTSAKLLKKGGVHEKSPGKKPEKRINHLKNAGKLHIPFTTGLLLGIGESFEDRVHDLYLIRDIYEKYGHIQEIIIQNFEYKKGIPYIPKGLISIKDMLRIAGIAKLIFKNEIAIQVPPNLIKGYEKNFIEMGIDDFGGISPFSQDFINPEKEWPKIKYLKKVVEEEEYILKERLPIYNKYIINEFCPQNIRNLIESSFKP